MQKVESGQPKQIHTIENIEELKKLLIYSFLVSQQDISIQDDFFSVLLCRGLIINPNLLSDEMMESISTNLKIPHNHKKIELEKQKIEFKKQLKVLKSNLDYTNFNENQINNIAHLIFVRLIKREIYYQREGRPAGGEHKFSSVLHQELKHSNPNFYQNVFVNTLVFSLINAKNKSLELWCNFRELCFMFQENNGKMLVPNDPRFSDIMPEFQK